MLLVLYMLGTDVTGGQQAYLNVGYVYGIPHRPQEAICKAHDKHVLHHLLAQVVINSAGSAATVREHALLWFDPSTPCTRDMKTPLGGDVVLR